MNPLSLLIGCVLAATTMLAAGQTDYPGKPVRLVHPYPGGAIDSITRIMADRLKDKWGQPVVVDPRPGASEIVAADAVAKARGDGLTWLVATESTFANNGSLFRKLPFDPAADLVPVSELFAVNFALIVRGNFPARTLQEFIDYAKTSPGKVKYGSIGVGTGPHLAMEDFARAVGVRNLLHVPYKTPPQAIQDMLGGEIDVVLAATPFGTPFMASGKMRMLAITGAARQKDLPDVPTFRELGLAGVSYRSVFCLAVPRGTPPDVVQKIYTSVREVIASPEFIEKQLAPAGYELVASDPRTFSQSLAARRQQAQRLISELDIRID